MTIFILNKVLNVSMNVNKIKIAEDIKDIKSLKSNRRSLN